MLAAENHNLASDEQFPDELANEVAQEIHQGWDADDGSRTEWLKKHAYFLSLYSQTDFNENSDTARSWGSKQSVPIISEACDQFQARTYKTFFPQDTFVSAKPVRTTTENRKFMEQRAKRIGDHMSYQLAYRMRNYKSDKDALFHATALHGSFFTKTYHDTKKLLPRVDNVRPTNLVVNYNVGPVRIEDLRRKTHVIHTTVGDTQRLVNEGYFIRPAMAAQSMETDEFRLKVDEIQGLQESQFGLKSDNPAVLLEQHFYLDLNGDGEFRPYIGTICAASRKLLRLSIGYESDPMGNPLKDYEQVQYFTHYKFKEDPNGFYGMGLGHSLSQLNTSANILLRQILDAGTLANYGNMSGFISERLGIEGDELVMELGKFPKISDTVGDIQNGIFQFNFPGPNQALIAMLESIDQRAQRLGSAVEATTGTPSRAEQATTYLAQIEQALELFSSVQIRLADSMGQELQKIFHLNQKFLPLVDYYVVNETPEQITRSDYAEDMMIMPVFDPKFSTQQQKMARANAELQGTLQNPVNQTRPQSYDAAFRRYFEALDTENIEELIPLPQPPENFDDQETENMFFLMPQESRPNFDVFPEHDHKKHLAELDQFLEEFGQALLPDQQQLVLSHRMKHEAFLYGQEHGIIEAQPADAPAMEERPGDEMGNAAAAGDIPPAPSINAPQIA